MFRIVSLLCILLVNFSASYKLPNGGKIWALLVAGSNEYYNYRHQADVCHAYQILHNNGIPDENIIVMMYDDIAYNEENPTPGVIINHPDGKNVYPNVLKDYVGTDVNSTNFLKILQGDAAAMKGIGSGRVINSGPNDHVFVNFVDHGAPGLLAFPVDELYADDLESALRSMALNKRFAKMVLYIEACESGSMFDSILPDSWNIFVMTAADPHESSYACYYDTERQTYLGDVFSVMWMEDSEQENLLRESLHHQYEIVRTLTNTSHVEEYGNLDIGSSHVAEFLGFRMKSESNGDPIRRSSTEDAVISRHVPVAILQKKLEQAKTQDEKKVIQFQLRKLLKLRRHLESTMKTILLKLAKNDESKVNKLMNSRHPVSKEMFPCYKILSKQFSKKCFNFSKNPYAFSQLYMLVNLCVEEWTDVHTMAATINNVCEKFPTLSGIM